MIILVPQPQFSVRTYCCCDFLMVVIQTLALSACTTLVSVEPKLAIETRNYVLKVTLQSL